MYGACRHHNIIKLFILLFISIFNGSISRHESFIRKVEKWIRFIFLIQSAKEKLYQKRKILTYYKPAGIKIQL